MKAAVRDLLETQKASDKPLAIVLAGHNGSGKSTLWYRRLAPIVKIPLVNADRMMLSILPEKKKLPKWAADLRDNDENWMAVAQKGVEGFVAQAMGRKVPFAMETVFSYWMEKPDGTFASKVDRIREMQAAGYFVVLLFVGLKDEQLSILRVSTRVQLGGHGVATDKLVSRFPRTQQAIREATGVADASLLLDNSTTEEFAFSVCHIRLRDQTLFDIREGGEPLATHLAWLDIVRPLDAPQPKAPGPA